MHDIDRTLRENEYADDLDLAQEFNDEWDQEDGFETEQPFSYEEELDPELSDEFDQEFLYEEELSGNIEAELAGDLMNIQNEEELDLFLGKLVRRAGRAVGKFARSSAGRAIGGVLKSVAKKALPIAGKALGTFVGGPLGGALGGKLGTMATRLFELDLEGMSPQDQQYEVSRAYVRFANAALKQGAAAARNNPNAQAKQIVRAALKKSAQLHAPGLLKKKRGSNGQYNRSASAGQRGSWVRKGNRVVLYNM